MRALRCAFYRLRVALPSGVGERGRLLSIMTRLHNFRTRFGHNNEIATVYGDGLAEALIHNIERLQRDNDIIERRARAQCAADDFNFQDCITERHANLLEMRCSARDLSRRFQMRGGTMYSDGLDAASLAHLRACGLYCGIDGEREYTATVAAMGECRRELPGAVGRAAAATMARAAEAELHSGRVAASSGRSRHRAVILSSIEEEPDSEPEAPPLVLADHIAAAAPLFRRFGIDTATAATLVDRYADAATLAAQDAPNTLPFMGSPLAAQCTVGSQCGVDNQAIGLITGDIDSSVINYFLALLASASNGQVAFLDSTLASVLPGGEHAHLNVDDLAGVMQTLNNVHLDRPVVVIPWHVTLGGPRGARHWILVVIDHRSRTVTIAEPLGGGVAATHVDAVRTATRTFLSRARATNPTHAVWAGLQPGQPQYAINIAPDTLPSQDDGSSCGAFILVYTYFLVFYGRLPIAADFAGDFNTAEMAAAADGTWHLPLRMVVLDAVLNGAVRVPLVPVAASGSGAGSSGTGISRRKRARTDSVTGSVCGGALVPSCAVTLSTFAIDFDKVTKGFRYGRLIPKRMPKATRKTLPPPP